MPRLDPFAINKPNQNAALATAKIGMTPALAAFNNKTIPCWVDLNSRTTFPMSKEEAKLHYPNRV